MSKKAIVIGAGQIGRGFIGERLYESGYEIVFFDAVQALIDEINDKKEYRVIILGEEDQRKMVKNVRAVSSLSEAAVTEILDADVIATAVGARILPKIAPLIAKGISMRMQQEITKPLDVIACENMDAGTSHLFGCIKEHFGEEELAYCEKYVGFPDAEVSRIVVPIKAEEALTVKVEKYMEWVVDETRVKGNLNDIQGLKISADVEAYVRRKIFTLTGHAMLGYLGYEKGLEFIWNATTDQEIFTIVYHALEECGQAWSHEYHLPLSEFMEYSSYMLIRFADQRIRDSVTRPCREPIRKLSAAERFFGPALAALDAGVEPVNIVKGIKAALKYDYADDHEAVELQKRIAEKGIARTLAEITGLPETHKLIQMVTE
ncbi:MAG: mannitol-1-phosphate 5-dehydrogenase [Lachnospiraceae bacterium]